MSKIVVTGVRKHILLKRARNNARTRTSGTHTRRTKEGRTTFGFAGPGRFAFASIFWLLELLATQLQRKPFHVFSLLKRSRGNLVTHVRGADFLMHQSG